MSTFRIAWRNLLRNRRRTAITVTAVAFNTGILIASLALMEGMRVQMLRSATRLLVGDAQIHAPNFRAERSMYDDIKDADSLVANVHAKGMLAAPRSYGFGLISSGAKSAGAMFVGVVPEAEEKAFELAREMASGAYLKHGAERQVVIGNKLARSLNADIGTELVAVVQAADGSIGNELYTVGGILKTVGEDIDRGAVFFDSDDFAELFVSAGRVHEIAINGRGVDSADIVALLQPTARGVVVESWRDIMPMVSDMVNMMGAMVALFGFVFFLGAGLGVLNTMLMATHDRVREFGVLKALGATPWRIIRDVTTEGFVLALVSTAFGLAIGVATGVYLNRAGIDLRNVADSSFGFAGIAWDPLWRGYMTLGDVVTSVVAMWAACVLASLYPAIMVARLDAARAMTHV